MITPEARKLEAESQLEFSEMRRTPTQSWCQFHEVRWHPLIRFIFIARDYGIVPLNKKLSAAEALERHQLRLEAETPPLP